MIDGTRSTQPIWTGHGVTNFNDVNKRWHLAKISITNGAEYASTSSQNIQVIKCKRHIESDTTCLELSNAGSWIMSDDSIS